MVMIMKLKSINGNNLINKPTRHSAPELHKLFNKYSASFEIPTARELIIKQLTWWKWIEKYYTSMATPFSEDAESQELCNLINIDWDDLDETIIDKHLEYKRQNNIVGKPLTFKDFKLKS